MLLMQAWNAAFQFGSICVPPKMFAVPVRRRGVFFEEGVAGESSPVPGWAEGPITRKPGVRGEE